LNLGSKSFFPKNTKNEQAEDILNAFLVQYYLNSLNTQRPIPATIIINLPIADQQLLDSIFKQQCKHKVNITANTRGERKKWLELAINNANNTLNNRLSQKAKIIEQFEQLQDVLLLDELPQRIEFFISPHQCLLHGCIIIPRSDIVYIKASVI